MVFAKNETIHACRNQKG